MFTLKYHLSGYLTHEYCSGMFYRLNWDDGLIVSILCILIWIYRIVMATRNRAFSNEKIY